MKMVEEVGDSEDGGGEQMVQLNIKTQSNDMIHYEKC